MEATSRKSRFLLIKYLLMLVAVMAVILTLATLGIMTIIGSSGSGFAIGLSYDQNEFSLLGIQVIGALLLAYFVSPKAVESIRHGKSSVYVGIISLLICWTVPWFLLSTIVTLPDYSWSKMLANIIISLMPSLIIGPLIGRAIKKEVLK